MKKSIYLDYAAATPVAAEVLRAMEPYFTGKFFNPSALYLEGRRAKAELNEIREKAAMVLGAKPAEIIFTAGSTEANNLAVQGVMRQFPRGEALVSSIEHESVLAPVRLFKHQEIPAGKDGRIILNKLSNLINDETVLVSVMYVNNELGTVQPLKDIARLIAEVRRQRLAQANKQPIYLHADAAQAGNYLDLHVSRLGVDLMSLNSGKIYGPKQSGALFVRAGVKLQPLILGGGQELGLRAGTENLAAAAGFAEALSLAQKNRAEEAVRVMQLRQFFEEQLQARLPRAIVNGGKRRAPHLVSVTFEGNDNEILLMKLDEAGIQVATGSACSASSDEPSHVLRAIGLTDDQARSTLRISLGRQTSVDELEYVAKTLSKLISS